MDREKQIAAMETFKERMEKHADRVMSVPAIRESVTQRIDAKIMAEYEEKHSELRYAHA